MGVLKNELKANFTQIPNELLLDKRLSASAKILYCYIKSKPSNWKVLNADIKKNLKFSKETISKKFKELISTGWISRRRDKNKKGQFCGYKYTLSLKKINNKIVCVEECLDCNKKWDKALGIEERFYILKNISNKNKEEFATKIKLMNYKDFLNTPYWKTISSYLKITRGKCEKCGSDIELHTHHKTYEHHGYELFHLSDLEVLCAVCHYNQHKEKK